MESATMIKINVEQKAKDVLATLFEIQPRINVAGLDAEAAKLTEMKGDLQAMVASFKPVYPGDVIRSATGGVDHNSPSQIMAGIVKFSREDAVSSFLELKRYMISRPSENMLDEQLQATMLRAEVFVMRVAEYLNYKAQEKIINNEVNHG